MVLTFQPCWHSYRLVYWVLIHHCRVQSDSLELQTTPGNHALEDDTVAVDLNAYMCSKRDETNFLQRLASSVSEFQTSY